MNFDRFDICEAYYVFACLWHGGQTSEIYKIFGQLERMSFKPSMSLGLETLSENSREIFNQLCEKHGFPIEDFSNEQHHQNHKQHQET
jgi:hypothetical protein